MPLDFGAHPRGGQACMNELRRTYYLGALGIDSYVSRRQLPGAAVTRRLAIASIPRTAEPVPVESEAPAADLQARPAIPRLEPKPRARTEHAASPPPQGAQPAATVPRFSLVTLVAGDWLWLEDLAGMPLTTEQVQLVQAMAHALLNQRALRDPGRSPMQSPAAGPGPVRPEVMQFDWPIHSNRQLDQGEEAAQAGVLGFITRRLEQHRCRGLVLLGQPCAARVPTLDLGVTAVCTASSADILANPVLKRQVWRDLQPLLDPR